MRFRLAWAFALVALAVILLTVAGVNAGMYWSMGHLMPHGPGAHMMGPGDETMAITAGALLRWSAGAALAALAVAAATGWWQAGRIAAPLADLARAARQVGLRDLGHRVAVPASGDEVAELAQSFNRMAERLQAEDQARRQMLADVAHELRHPVAVIQAQLELLQDGVRPLVPENVAPLQDEVLRLGRLIGDLQDLSLAEAGVLRLSWQTVTAAQALEPVLANLGPVAEEKGIALEAAVDPAAPAVRADPQRLRQVLVNLVTNALRHTPPGGKVVVSAGARDGHLELAVTDNGSGIDPADLPHLFDRFYRADRSRSRQGGGTGLGLAICRSLVTLHGGRIWAESKPGRGSRFVVSLPTVDGLKPE